MTAAEHPDTIPATPILIWRGAPGWERQLYDAIRAGTTLTVLCLPEQEPTP